MMEWRVHIVLRQPCQLQRDVPKERCVVEIAAPQAPRILQEAVQPLATYAFDPRSAIANAPGMKVERGPDAEQEPVVNARKQPSHKQLLSRRADAYPDDVGPAAIEQFDQLLFF